MSTDRWMVALVLSAAVSLTGCVSHLSPSIFEVPTGGDTLVDVQRALSQQGVTADRVDEALGIVETPWESTGTNADGTIWAIRYLITVAPRGAAARVTVVMDLRTCEGGLGTNPHTGRLDASSCARLPEGTTPSYYQSQLEDFAASLRSALGGVVVAS